MGDTATGSWDSSGLLGYIRREEGEIVEKKLPIRAIRVEADGEFIALTRASGSLVISIEALQVLCQFARVPWDYAKTLPRTLLAQNINHGLAESSGQIVTLVLEDEWLKEIRP